jgi:alkanesulfonate monooxygenase SsuD/methylene tetrahydromethanopterin reductase-like flavin-dependent oxidoreductase (luciferase family)
LFSTADRDSYEAAHEAVYAIRNILNEFPLHWQIAIVKALGARTAVLPQQRQQPPSVLSA